MSESTPNPEDLQHMVNKRYGNSDAITLFMHLPLQGLLDWMSSEMNLRIRATAPVRCVTQNPRSSIKHIQQKEQISMTLRDKCWICHSSRHWTDQCDKFKAPSRESQFKMATFEAAEEGKKGKKTYRKVHNYFVSN